MTRVAAGRARHPKCYRSDSDGAAVGTGLLPCDILGSRTGWWSRDSVDPNREYVLFASTGVGLGYLLTALLNSAYYAWRTGSAFAIDMREFHYVSVSKNAGFFEHFALEY